MTLSALAGEPMVTALLDCWPPNSGVGERGVGSAFQPLTMLPLTPYQAWYVPVQVDLLSLGTNSMVQVPLAGLVPQ